MAFADFATQKNQTNFPISRSHDIPADIENNSHIFVPRHYIQRVQTYKNPDNSYMLLGPPFQKIVRYPSYNDEHDIHTNILSGNTCSKDANRNHYTKTQQKVLKLLNRFNDMKQRELRYSNEVRLHNAKILEDLVRRKEIKIDDITDLGYLVEVSRIIVASTGHFMYMDK